MFNFYRLLLLSYNFSFAKVKSLTFKYVYVKEYDFFPKVLF